MMPAYNFKKQFAPLVGSGEKRQTVRFPRKRQTVKGDTLYLYTGMRTSACRKLVDPTPCTAVLPVMFNDLGMILDGAALQPDQADAFAQADEVYQVVGDKVVRVEQFTEDARYVPTYALAIGYINGMDKQLADEIRKTVDDASV